MSPRPVDHGGKRFGRLTVISYAGPGRFGTGALWLCRCKCGTTKVIRAAEFVRGRTTSCGCFNREVSSEYMSKCMVEYKAAEMAKINCRHAATGTQLYGIWIGMLGRCYNSRLKAYKYYGGRGIKVCGRWRKGEEGMHPFILFKEDMGKRPSPKHSLDRKNNNGHYEPSNCRWATSQEQSSNQTHRNHFSPKRKRFLVLPLPSSDLPMHTSQSIGRMLRERKRAVDAEGT